MSIKYLDPQLGIDIPYKPARKVKPQIKEVRHGKIDFYTVRFPAMGTRRGKLLMLHGWCEHTTMYYRVMEYFSSQGYECFVFDQRGAGRTSLGKYRGRSGRTLETALQDVDKMIEYFVLDNKASASEKFYILGHSAGGGIALDYMINGKYRNKITGIVTTGPMIKIADSISPSPYVEYVLNLIATWLPYFPWGSINRDPNVRSTITTANEWVDYLQKELLTQGNGTIGQIKNMFDRGYKLSNTSAKEMSDKINPNIKLLTIHCVNDTMTSFKSSKMFFDKLPISDKQFVEFDKGNHSLFIETEEIFNETCMIITRFLAET